MGQDGNCAPVGNRRWPTSAQAGERVTNPPQVTNLPHKSGAETITLFCEIHWRASKQTRNEGLNFALILKQNARVDRMPHEPVRALPDQMVIFLFRIGSRRTVRLEALAPANHTSANSSH